VQQKGAGFLRAHEMNYPAASKMGYQVGNSGNDVNTGRVNFSIALIVLRKPEKK
jgi:hypothetical protein